ncbi:MAG: 50S ribosomal protein L11 methyltransferase [Chlamydiae bacterium]|nr:50S ribosomal protein L11 methyltransferase [Chlamydiota bacterium]
MKKHYQFLAKPTSLLQDAQNELMEIGLEDLYVIQEVNKEQWLLGGTASKTLPEILKHLELSSIEPEIDWAEQSALFSPYFSEGKIRVPLSEFSSIDKKLLLEPGAGFGDLSHPTTRLTLKNLSEHVKDAYVLDIGCGSGVLSIGASLMGSLFVSGIDIDPAALLHAEINKTLNSLDDVEFSMTPSTHLDNESQWVALMNMTFLEQKMAWGSLKGYHRNISTLIVSGILTEQRDAYLTWSFQNEWKLVTESEEEGWISFVFISSFKG